jgi:hypothetical protein
VQTDVSWFREECVGHAGEETLGEPLQQGGKRRSRPLPTNAIDEAVGECGSGRHTARRFGKYGVVRSMSG